jgi:hypothetical protein
MIMMDKEKNDKMENKKRDMLFEPVFIIAFLTALFYVCTYTYLSSFYIRLCLPMVINEPSFAAILGSGNMVVQLLITFVIIIFPLIVIYNNHKSYITWLIILVLYSVLAFAKIFLKEFVKWNDRIVLNAFIVSFVLYFIIFIFRNHSKLNAIKEFINANAVKQITHQHILG